MDDKKQIILRQIADHIFQSFERIDYNIEYIVFLRKNSKIKDISQKFYITQIDRFSRDTLLTFSHILSNDKKSNTLQSIINTLIDTKIKKDFNTKIETLRNEIELITKHRNKMVAHHDTKFNAEFGDYYPAQLPNYIYPINPCVYMDKKEKLYDFFGELKEASLSEGVGIFHFGAGSPREIFKKEILGESKSKDSVFIHECSRKNCLLK